MKLTTRRHDAKPPNLTSLANADSRITRLSYVQAFLEKRESLGLLVRLPSPDMTFDHNGNQVETS
jgi:hypothetical protein